MTVSMTHAAFHGCDTLKTRLIEEPHAIVSAIASADHPQGILRYLGIPLDVASLLVATMQSLSRSDGIEFLAKALRQTPVGATLDRVWPQFMLPILHGFRNGTQGTVCTDRLARRCLDLAITALAGRLRREPLPPRTLRKLEDIRSTIEASDTDFDHPQQRMLAQLAVWSLGDPRDVRDALNLLILLRGNEAFASLARERSLKLLAQEQL